MRGGRVPSESNTTDTSLPLTRFARKGKGVSGMRRENQPRPECNFRIWEIRDFPGGDEATGKRMNFTSETAKGGQIGGTKS